MRARHSRPALGVVFSAFVLVIAAGCSTPDPTPDPFAVLTSAGPGGRYSLEAIVAPQPESDGRFAVAAKLLGQDADLGLQSSVDLLTVDAGHLVAWADGKTVIWDGRITMNLETGGRQTLAVPGAYTVLDSAYSAERRSIAHLAVRAGDLEVWTATVDQTRPELIYSERLDTAFGEIRGRIGWGGPGLVYFAVPRRSRSVILGVSEDGASATIVESAANPAPSPDGRYLAYTSVAAGSELSTEVIDLETMQVTCRGLPWGTCAWSPDSRLLAVQQVERIDVFSVPSGAVVATVSPEAAPVLTHFVGSDLVYAEARLAGDYSHLESIRMRSVTPQAGP